MKAELKPGKFEMAGEVVQCLRGGMFRVKLDDSEHVILCRPAGRLIIRHIFIQLADRVVVRLDASDWTKGVITWRHK